MSCKAKSPRKVLSDEALDIIAARFKALSEPVRLKLIMSLQQGETNVTDLVKFTGRGQTTVSRHLQQLVKDGILARRRNGVCVYYKIADPAIFELCNHVCGSLHRQFTESGNKASVLFKV